MIMTTESWVGIFKLIEEMGELQQVLGKLCQTPNGKHWSGDLNSKLCEELTDVQQALDFFVLVNESCPAINHERYADKRAKYHKWLAKGELRGINDE
jgi:hypothetical protein